MLAVLINVAGPQEPRLQHGFKQHAGRQDGDVSRHGAYADQVEQEVTDVVGTDAVVHPDAVVVETLDAPVAHS